MKNNLKNIIVFLTFFIYPVLIFVPFDVLGVSINLLPISLKTIYLIAINTIFLCSVLMVYNEDFIKYFKDFKKNGKKYIDESIKYWYLGLFIMIVANLLINTLTPSGLPNNEEAVRTLLETATIYTIFATIIYAPIVEEIICRKIIRDFISNKWLFIVISALIFGGAHVMSSITSLWDLLYVIPYGALGWAFAYSFYKTGNLLTSIFLHFLHNGILILLYLAIF